MFSVKDHIVFHLCWPQFNIFSQWIASHETKCDHHSFKQNSIFR